MKLKAGTYKLVVDDNGTECTYDENGNEIHHKDSDGYEAWVEYDSKGNVIHLKNSDGEEVRYNANGKPISKKEYDKIYAHSTAKSFLGKIKALLSRFDKWLFPREGIWYRGNIEAVYVQSGKMKRQFDAARKLKKQKP